jgi:hypothetical protein
MYSCVLLFSFHCVVDMQDWLKICDFVCLMVLSVNLLITANVREKMCTRFEAFDQQRLTEMSVSVVMFAHGVWQLLIQLISSNCVHYELAGCIICEDLVWHCSCTWILCRIVSELNWLTGYLTKSYLPQVVFHRRMILRMKTVTYSGGMRDSLIDARVPWGYFVNCTLHLRAVLASDRDIF